MGNPHDVRVKEANPSDVRFPIYRHRRLSGYDHRHYSGGYQAYCKDCGWVGEITARSCEAHADAEKHQDDTFVREVLK